MAHRVSGESAIARPSPRRTAGEPSVPRRYAALAGPPPWPDSVKSSSRPSSDRSATHDASSHDRSRSSTSPGRLRDHDRAIVGMRDHEASVRRGVPQRRVAGHPRDRAPGAAGSHRAQRAKQRPFIRRGVPDFVALPGQAVDVEVLIRERRHRARLIDDRDFADQRTGRPVVDERHAPAVGRDPREPETGALARGRLHQDLSNRKLQPVAPVHAAHNRQVRSVG